MRIRAIIALAVAVVGVMFVAPAANASAYPPTICPTLSASTTHPLPGEEITVSGSDFLASTNVRLELRPGGHVLANVTTDSTGSFSTVVKLPNTALGSYRIVAATGAPDIAGCPVPGIDINIHGGSGSSGAGGGPGGGTSFTGVDVLIMLIAAAVLIGAGVAFNRSGKRRRSAHAPL